MNDELLDFPFDKEKIRQEYEERSADYERLAVNLQQALKGFLKENSIHHLDISYRLKEVDSFIEKISRKSYADPFSECEDLCGLRIICYYPSDVNRICQIIREEFDIQEAQDKSELLKVQEFGYRSTHFVVRANKNWLIAPNYRGLGELKAELQVRTILMHAWAEIEHKLAYKSASQVPKDFQRKLFRLSAKFEEADEQFEDLRTGLHKYRQNLSENANKRGQFDKDVELNLDTLRAFLDFAFPKRKKNSAEDMREVLEQATMQGFTMSNLVDIYEAVGDLIPEYEDGMKANNSPHRLIYFSQIGALRTLLNFSDPSKVNSIRIMGKRGQVWKSANNKLAELGLAKSRV